MTTLSVNINKVATIRNSRGGNNPDVVQVAKDIEHFGADGITVHPRPDERHIRYSDVYALKKIITTEFNIEGNPQEEKFVTLVLEVLPTQVTLVPDALGQITSNHGWDCIANMPYLQQTIAMFKAKGVRTSIFLDPVIAQIEAAAKTGTDRIELYTEAYAHMYEQHKEAAILPYVAAAAKAQTLGLGINAGHDLNLQNLKYFAENVLPLHEVSIGHALISDSLYYGLQNTVQMYKRQLNTAQ
jgi:pyridoxine 5-phosphate synthase